MIEYPRCVFMFGGDNPCHGGSFSQLVVNDDCEMSLALEKGWVATLPEIFEPKKTIVDEPIEEISQAMGDITSDDAPPTRAEMEAELNRRGIKFHHKMGDKKLMELINKS